MILIVGGYEEGVSWAWYQQMATMGKFLSILNGPSSGYPR